MKLVNHLFIFMNLSQKLLLNQSLIASDKLEIPDNQILNLPEKVLQFGTGVLLRGLPDYFIDKANKQGIFKGSVVVVKSTQGQAKDFAQQDNLYTLTIRGLENGEAIERHILNASISRAISANEQWEEILNTCQNPDIQIVISNTTEVGLQYSAESIFQNPPSSFPAKLTAWLYTRFKNLGANSPKMVIIPCELIPDNGKLLAEMVDKLIDFNELGLEFKSWLQAKVIFCNSLVDRIVTGMPDPETAQKIYADLGYEDRLLTVCEPYKLWAIEGNAEAKTILSFAQADENVIVEPDISFYRERKLRILNGSHSISVCRGYLRGFNTVLECMQDTEMSNFFKTVIENEILPTLSGFDVQKLNDFGEETLNRYRNPFLKHWLLNITLQCTSKMKMRIIPTLFRYYEKTGEIPEKILEGFAYYLFFMRVVEQQNGQYFGSRKGEKYVINDEFAPYFAENWQKVKTDDADSLQEFCRNVCENTTLWGENLNRVSGFSQRLFEKLKEISK